MKRMAAVLVTLCLLVLPVSAVPYTESELEEYMEAIYCEPVWAGAFEDYQAQFIDTDVDGRLELITMEAGEEYAPKKAEVYEFMDAEFSGRGAITVGKLEMCRDPKTDESFMVSRIKQDGNTLCQRLVYDHEAELILAQDLSPECAARLEDYGYSPVVVTKADCADIRVYEDCRAIFIEAYKNTVYTNGTPPIAETWDPNAPLPKDTARPLVISAVALAVAIAIATAAWRILRRRAKR